MKLLIVTQVIDTEHPILGFFHRWVEKFAEKCEEVHVICLEEHNHNLPSNVKIYSLGKEEEKGRFTYLLRFYAHILKLQNNYDCVFVHMNQEYVLLGGLLWKLLGKKVTMWRNHFAGSALTQIAGKLSSKVFYTSDASYTARFKNAVSMPIGIDETIFRPMGVNRRKGSLLYVGRISPAKRIEAIIQALEIALQKKPSLTLTIVGGATEGAGAYEESLKIYAKEHGLPVIFVGPISWDKLPKFYSSHELCVNLSPPGMFDKVIGEALLCECDVITTNPDSTKLGIQTISSSTEGLTSLATAIVEFNYDKHKIGSIKAQVLAHHGIEYLVNKVVREYI